MSQLVSELMGLRSMVGRDLSFFRQVLPGGLNHLYHFRYDSLGYLTHRENFFIPNSSDDCVVLILIFFVNNNKFNHCFNTKKQKKSRVA